MNTDVKKLKLFIEKAEKLENKINFIKKVFGKKIGITAEFKCGRPPKYTRHGPNQTQIDAFVLTFRFFIQDNEKEGTSFHDQSEVYSRLVVPQNLKERFNEIRKALNSYLDSSTLAKTFPQITLTNRVIMNTFIYGELAHVNLQKKKKYDEWMQDNKLANLLTNQFVVILTTVFQAIKDVSVLNGEVLKELQRETKEEQET